MRLIDDEKINMPKKKKKTLAKAAIDPGNFKLDLVSMNKMANKPTITSKKDAPYNGFSFVVAKIEITEKKTKNTSETLSFLFL